MLDLYSFLQTVPVELVSVLELLFGCVVMIAMICLWQWPGACAYIAVATIVANIEVLKGARFDLFHEVVALGNVTFGTVTIAVALVNEIYGQKQAKQCISIGFATMLTFSIFMVFAIGYKPVKPLYLPYEMAYLGVNHGHIKQLFMYSLDIACASLISFFVSGRIEIFMLSGLKVIIQPGPRHDIIRMYIASFVAICADLFMMNYMAWILLPGRHISLSELFNTYIFASLVFRALAAMVTYPALFVARAFLR